MGERLSNAPTKTGWELYDRTSEGRARQTRNWGWKGYSLLLQYIYGSPFRIELAKIKSEDPEDSRPINPKDILSDNEVITLMFIGDSPRKLSRVLTEYGLPRVPRGFRREVAEVKAYSQKTA